MSELLTGDSESSSSELSQRINAALDLHKPEPIRGLNRLILGWYCIACCLGNSPNCEHGEDHRGVNEDHACATRAALLGIDWPEPPAH